MGEAPAHIVLVETEDDVDPLEVADPEKVAYISADHALGRRDARDHRPPARALPEHHRPAHRRHLLRHHQPPGGGQADGRAVRPGAGHRLAQLVELQPAGRRRPRRRRRGAPDRQRGPGPRGVARRQAHRRHQLRRERARGARAAAGRLLPRPRHPGRRGVRGRCARTCASCCRRPSARRSPRADGTVGTCASTPPRPRQRPRSSPPPPRRRWPWSPACRPRRATARSAACSRARPPSRRRRSRPLAYAKTSPQQEYIDILHREVGLLANGRAVAAFLRARLAAASGAPAPFTAADLLADAKLLKQLKPKPATADDLQPTLDLLAYHGVIAAKGGGSYDPVVDAATKDLKTAALDTAATDIGKFSAGFDARAALKDRRTRWASRACSTRRCRPAPRASSRRRPTPRRRSPTSRRSSRSSWCGRPPGRAAGRGRRSPASPWARSRRRARTRRASTSSRCRWPAGRSRSRCRPPTWRRSSRLRPARTTRPSRCARRSRPSSSGRAAGWTARRASTRSRSRSPTSSTGCAPRNRTFVGGTYPKHDWGEFSVDIFLNVGEDAQGFYKLDPGREVPRRTVDTHRQRDPPFGKFAWRAVYNDDRMIARIGPKYGARRITKAPHHGPAPDKLHIHLDLRPVNLVPDPVTGFTVNPSGRVQLFWLAAVGVPAPGAVQVDTAEPAVDAALPPRRRGRRARPRRRP